MLEIGIIVVLIALPYLWYALIVSKKNSAKEALSGIDVQLRKRSNLIPNILKIAQKFMDHEKKLLNDITTLRAKAAEDYNIADPKAVETHLKNISELDAAMNRFNLTMEAYPDLKSDQTMLQAQKTYNEVEEHIAAARRFYNAAVTSLNNSIEIFPGNLFAGFAKASPMPFYETDAASKVLVDADDHLK